MRLEAYATTLSSKIHEVSVAMATPANSDVIWRTIIEGLGHLL